MIFLLLSISATALIFVIFKLFNRYNVNTLQAIVINYITAGVTGILNYNGTISIPRIINENWFWGAFILGILFITLFNIMALTAQRNGLSVASVASKMSVVIPIVFGLYAYNEHLNTLKTIAIALALVAVYLTAQKKTPQNRSKKSMWLPAVLFIGSGILDALLKYLETTYVAKNDIPIFSASIFFIAGAFGIGFMLVQYLKTKTTPTVKTLLGGIGLGVINYYSIYLLLKALQLESLESSTVFTINNVAIVMLSTLLGLILFKERLERRNWFGIGIAISAIVLIAMA